jgi:hypothetical protein
VVTRRDGDIELDPRATGACVVRLDENGDRDLCETVHRVARMSVLGSLALRGGPADSRQLYPKCVEAPDEL